MSKSVVMGRMVVWGWKVGIIGETVFREYNKRSSENGFSQIVNRFQTTFAGMIVNGGICRDRNHQMLRKRRGIGCVVLYSVADGKLCGLFGFLSIRHGRLCICTMQRGGQGTFAGGMQFTMFGLSSRMAAFVGVCIGSLGGKTHYQCNGQSRKQAFFD